MLKKLKRTLIIGCAAAMLLSTTAMAALPNYAAYTFEFHLSLSQIAENTGGMINQGDRYCDILVNQGNLQPDRASAFLVAQNYHYENITDYQEFDNEWQNASLYYKDDSYILNNIHLRGQYKINTDIGPVWLGGGVNP